MSDKKTPIIDFGYYCSIEQHRFGADNEFYTYKVVGRMQSNTWVEVPVVDNEVVHDEMADVVYAICGGVGESTAAPRRFRVCDLHQTWLPQTDGIDDLTD